MPKPAQPSPATHMAALAKTPISDPDDARSRQLNDQLRVSGRGGVVTVSLALAAAGLPTIEKALRAVAAVNAGDGTGNYGIAHVDIGTIHWRIVQEGDTLILSAWLEAEALP